MLGLGILIPPAALDAGWPIPDYGTRQAEIQFGCNQFRLQYLVRQRYLLTAS
jgi:hypothetical protein